MDCESWSLALKEKGRMQRAGNGDHIPVLIGGLQAKTEAVTGTVKKLTIF
jgi:hypothetical protein